MGGNRAHDHRAKRDSSRSLDVGIFRIYKYGVTIEFDPVKRQVTLENRGLDMARAAQVFEGATLSLKDERADYDEARFITIGFLDHRMVVLVWTPRGANKRIISIRKANDREQKIYGDRMG